MVSNLHFVEYGSSRIAFNVFYKERKTLAIHVYPDSSIAVDAPLNTPLFQIEEKVLKRAKWIRRQQRYFNRFPPALPARKYISGESFRYLGRQYTLHLEKDVENSLKMLRGRLHVTCNNINTELVKDIVDAWYRKKAYAVFRERFDICLKDFQKKVNVTHSGKFKLRSMKTKWGSCSKKGLITLNPELVGASKGCVDYVITHELCHLVEYNHSGKFYALMDKVMPDWESRKDELEMSMEHRLL